MTRLVSHGKNFAMRLLLFVLTLTLSSAAFSAQQITGRIERIGFAAFLKSNIADGCNKYQIDVNSEEAAESIRKLSTGDVLTASGVIEKRACLVRIDSVDYVGLKDLLGYWYSKDGYMKVRDFTSVSVYSTVLANLKKNEPIEKVAAIEYRYSITPTNGTEWVLFLSTQESTTFATIKLQKKSATIKIYDSENGSVVRTIYLSKWGNLQ